MNLPETLEYINYHLKKEYGMQFDDRQTWRVVFAADQTEKRKMYTTDEGLDLMYPEVREVKKYQHIKPDRYVLERLVPVTGETDIVTKLSYEPVWTWEDRHGNYLPPYWDACKFLIDGILEKQANPKSHAKYKDPEFSPGYREKMIADMEYKLFGDETPIGDALAHGDGISYAGMKTFTTEGTKDE